MGDFGLAEDVYASGYFRQNDRSNVKVPYKWMALESLNDAIFTEKTDVVSQQCMVDQYGLISTPGKFQNFLCIYWYCRYIDLLHVQSLRPNTKTFIARHNYAHSVVVRCDCMGGFQWRTDPLPCRGPTVPHPAAGRGAETRETSHCSLCHRDVSVYTL